MITTTAHDLLHALTNAVKFAGVDKDRPILCSVHVSWAGGKLEVEATDSYSAIVQLITAENETGEVFDRAIPVSQIGVWVAALKTKPAKELPMWNVGLDVDGGRVRLLDASLLMPEPIVESVAIEGDKYPNLAPLVDVVADRPSITTAAFSPEKFAAFGALKNVGPLDLTALGPATNPMLHFATADEDVVGVLMGYRGEEE